jgi:hypothetical protein
MVYEYSRSLTSTAAVSLLLLWPAPSFAQVAHIQTRMSWRPFSFEYTRAASSFVGLSGDAVMNGAPLGGLVGLVGMLVSAPATVAAVPLDFLATPFRLQRTVRFELSGRLVDGLGTPLRDTAVTVITWGEAGAPQSLRHIVNTRSFLGRTDHEGNLALPVAGVLGPNRSFDMTVDFLDSDGKSDSGCAMSGGRSAGPAEMRCHGRWRLLPAGAPSQSPFSL